MPALTARKTVAGRAKTLERNGTDGRAARRRQALAHELAPEYRRRYALEILDRAGLAELVEGLPDGVSALLCVERGAGACHRSLIAERLATDHGASVRHLASPN